MAAAVTKPLAIDLYAGLGGWAGGLLVEGWDVVGFDIERHAYGAHRYPAQLVIQDVLTLHGSQFRDAALIVASPPCQEYSYMAMPWTRAKAKAAAIRADTTGKMLADLNRLFDACFRIQAQASLAAGRHIPMVVENVRGAQPWVGRARWNFGSYYLWGDVPALMPDTTAQKFNPDGTTHPQGSWFKLADSQNRGARKVPGIGWTGFANDGGISWRNRSDVIKNTGGAWFAVAHNTTSGKGQNPDGRKLPGFRFDGSGRSFQSASVKTVSHPNIRDGEPHTRHLTNPGEHGVKHHGTGEVWFDTGPAALPSSSPRRKAASAMIAKIPLPLARHIAACWHP